MPSLSQMPTGDTGSNRGSGAALSPPGCQGGCWGHVGGHGVDVAGESAVCSAEAQERGQDRWWGGCSWDIHPQLLPRPTAPKAAQFTPQAATSPGPGAPNSPPAPTLLVPGWGKEPKPPAAQGLGSRQRHAAASPAWRCSSTGCSAGTGRGRAERRLLAAVRALPWTGADLLLQNISMRLQEREGNGA